MKTIEVCHRLTNKGFELKLKFFLIFLNLENQIISLCVKLQFPLPEYYLWLFSFQKVAGMAWECWNVDCLQIMGVSQETLLHYF